MAIDAKSALNDAQTAVDALIVMHRQAAIPALIGACVAWGVEHGGADVIRGSLERAIDMSFELETANRKAMS